VPSATLSVRVFPLSFVLTYFAPSFLIRQASTLSEGELEHRISTLEGELRGAQDKAAAENKTHLTEVKALKDQIAVLKDSTKVRTSV